MLQKVQKFIEDNRLLDRDGGPVIVGVSGGCDSIVLLDILQKSGYQCIVAHCNFHLRTAESDRDMIFVRTLTETRGLPFYSVDFKTVKYAKEHHVSIEMAARELRYSWFEKIRQEHHAQAFAVGHHLDDNIETVLLNLVRGTGLKGLTGIPVRNGKIIRPLLGSSRHEIKEYVVENKLGFVEDSTNVSTDIIRNKFRHVIIPLLEEVNPSFKNSLSQTRAYLQGAYHIYQQAIQSIKQDLVVHNNSCFEVNIDKLQSFPENETILFEILKEFHFHPDQIRQVADTLNESPGKVFYSKSHRLLKDRKLLLVEPILDNINETTDLQSDSQLTDQENLSVVVFEKKENFVFSKDASLIHLDADKITLPLTLRKWQPADFFYPLGMQNKKKVSDFLIDEKINLFEKEKTQVLLSGNQIVWVVGRRIDERFKITDKTTNIIEIDCKL